MGEKRFQNFGVINPQQWPLLGGKMASKARPSLVGRRFLSVTGAIPPKLNKLYEWDWRAGWIRSSSSADAEDRELQLLLEFDELSWKDREWYTVYKQNPPEDKERKKDKEPEKEKKKKRRKTETDSEEEREEFQLFFVEDKLTVAHRPNSQGSSATTGTLYPALVFKPLVDKVDIFKTKKLPVEFLSDNKLVFQEYTHLKTITDWDPSIPGLAICNRSENEVKRWVEEGAGQRILLTTPSVLVGERVSVYRVEGTTQWYSAFIIGHNQETGEFTVTDDTVLEEHLENPEIVQMRILGEGVVQQILRGESVSVAPRRSRASAYRGPLKPRDKLAKETTPGASRVKSRRSSSATHSGKLKPRSKRRVSSESPQKIKSPSDKKIDRRRKSSSRVDLASANKKSTEEIPESPKSQTERKEVKDRKEDKEKKELKETKEVKEGKEGKESKESKDHKELKENKVKEVKEQKESKDLKELKELKEPEETKEPPSVQKFEQSSDSLEEILDEPEQKPKSPIPIRLLTKCKPKTDSDSDSDSRSTKSSASSTSKVARVFKKTFKGKAIAIVKPFSNAVTEKKSPTSEKQKDIQARLNLYEFGSDEEHAVNQRNKTSVASDNHDKDSLNITSEETDSNTSRVISSIKGIKRIKSVKQGLLSSRRLKFNPELKSVRVRVEKLRNNSGKSEKLSKVRQNLVKNKSPEKSSSDDSVESNLVIEKETLSSNSQSDSSGPKSSPTQTESNKDITEVFEKEKSLEKVSSESDISSDKTKVETSSPLGDEVKISECNILEIKEESSPDASVKNNEKDKSDLDKLVPSVSPSTASNNIKVEDISEIKVHTVKVESKTSDNLIKLEDEKVIDIVKSELFPEPLPVKNQPVKLEK